MKTTDFERVIDLLNNGRIAPVLQIIKEAYNTQIAEESKIEFTRIDNDVNGNPRYVCHFTNFRKPTESYVVGQYEVCLKRAKKLGGRKFNNKQYGGGIVFQSYNIHELEKKIKELVKSI